MSEKPRNLSTDLRGVGNLTIDAIIGITDVVEIITFYNRHFFRVIGRSRAGANNRYHRNGLPQHSNGN